MTVEQFTVKQLAALAGVSVRTLHLYDETGLLKPSVRTDKNYRLYGQAELLRLQQILFYKELDLPLKGIADILDGPNFDAVQALKSHKQVLKQKQHRIGRLLTTIDKTIEHLKNHTMLKPEDLYEGLPKEQAKQWQAEAKAKWGDAVTHAEQQMLKKTKQEFAALKQAAELNRATLQSLVYEDPTSDKVQQEIAVHYDLIREFWGTANTPDNQAEAYAGLGDLYVADERYTMVEGKPQTAFAEFMQKAMKHFAHKLS